MLCILPGADPKYPAAEAKSRYADEIDKLKGRELETW